jgi:hypothetical protein
VSHKLKQQCVSNLRKELSVIITLSYHKLGYVTQYNPH